jgi:acyl-CoA thioesterase FadM
MVDDDIPLIHTVAIPIYWGDCDEAGIVFYPNFFRWFDVGFQELLSTRGLSQRALRERHGIIGTALLDAGATFRAPGRHGDVLELSIGIGGWRRSSFRMVYRGRIGTTPVVDGFEVRGFVVEGAGGQLKARPIDPAFRAAFE